MIKEWIKVYQARYWMNRNKAFLPTWHAYIGYAFDLFDQFAEGHSIETIANHHQLDAKFLSSWVEVGVTIGHLSKTRDGRIQPAKNIMKYIARSSESSVGALLKEMMELHIPTLLYYPRMLSGESKKTFNDLDFGRTVAETSSYLEKIAYPKLESFIRKHSVHRVLDIGCGHAGYLIRLAKKYPHLQLTGIERNQEVWEQAKSNVAKEHLTQIELVHTNIEQWQGHPQSMDMIMMNNILYYFSSDQRDSLFAQLKTYLKPGGWVSIISPIHPSKQGKSFSSAFNIFMTSHDNLYALPAEQEIRELAEKHGFVEIEFKPVIREGSWYFITMRQSK